MVKAMRKDLGTPNWGLDEGDLARTMVDDFDEFYGEGDESEPVQPPEPAEEPRVTRKDRMTR